MQASQSSNASDLLTPDHTPDLAFPRSFPSPFAAPIQAARKYFERQRGDALQTGARERSAQEAGLKEKEAGANDRLAWNQGNQHQAGQDQSGQNPISREQMSREQDRRLERSLYGDSIEAALSFDGPLPGDGHDLNQAPGEVPRHDAGHGIAGQERAYLDDSDGSEPLFPYAEPGPLPDPAAVRGAILRLTRESELRAGTALKSSAENKPAENKPAENKPAGAGSVPPLAFGEVARRVWGADYPHFLAVPNAEHSRNAADQAAEASAATPMGPASSQRRGGDIRQIAEMENATEANGSGTAIAAQHRIHLQPPAPQSGSERTDAVQTRAARETRESTASEVLQARDIPKAAAASPARPAAGAEHEASTLAQEEPALAHDACNLLSALALYSELLASPGVLDAEHRHYAEELKLMAGRSQVLIDRLLRVAEARKTQGLPLEGHFASQISCPAVNGTGPGAAEETAPVQHRVGSREAAPAEVIETAVCKPEVEETTAARAPSHAIEAEALVSESLAPENKSSAEIPQSFTATKDGAQADHPEEVAAVPAVVPGESSSTAGQTGGAEEAPATSLVYLLMRWGSLLSTLAHGTLEVGFGPHAATPVPAGAEALERILVNLVRNARAATALGGAIRIGVGVADVGALPAASRADRPAGTSSAGNRGTMVLTVDDSGCGMSEAQVRRILGEAGGLDEPAIAAAPANCGQNESHGHRQGLGLQIVRQLVAASGGTLSIQSWPGRGTRVEIRWPVVVHPSGEVLETTGQAPHMAAQSHQAHQIATPETVEAIEAPSTDGPSVEAAATSVETPAAFAPLTAPETVTQPAPAAGLADAAASLAIGPPVGEASPSSRSLAAQPLRETAKEIVGPDGFSESELRAMMLRLHRTGPQERSPLRRRLDRRLWDARLATVRPADACPADGREGDHGLSVLGPSVSGPSVSASGVPVTSGPGPAANPDGWNHLAQNQFAHQGEATKGAIAC